MPGTSTEQVVDKGIRQKSTKRVNSFTDGSAFCPGAPKHVPSDSEKHRRVYTSSNVCHSHEWRVDTASGKTLKKRNACLHAVRQAVGKKLRVYTASEAKGLIYPATFCEAYKTCQFLFILFPKNVNSCCNKTFTG